MAFPTRSLVVLALFAPSVALAGQIVAAPTSGIALDEGAPRFGVSVSLSAPPLGTDTVQVGFRFAEGVDADCWSNPAPEVAVDCNSLAFTAANWDQPQMLWLYPNRDIGTFGPGTPLVDGDQPWSFEIEVRGTYPGFEGAPPVRISGITRDMDARGVFVYQLPTVVSETTGQTDAASSGSDPRPFILTAQPAADVRLELTSSDATEGAFNAGYNVYTFTPANWSITQTLTLVTIDDPVFDGDRAWDIVATFSSDDPDWDGVVHQIPMLTLDDEGGGIDVDPQSGLVTSEGGASDSFEVVLTEAPWRPIVIGSAPDDTEGVCTLEAVTFDADDWDTPRTVTVTGLDDAAADGDVTYDVWVEDWTPGFALGPELFVNGGFSSGVDGWAGSIGYGEDVFPNGMLTDAVGGFAIRQAVTGLEPGCEYRLVVDTEQVPVTPENLRPALPDLLRVSHRQVGDGNLPRRWAHFWHEGEQEVAYVAQWPATEFEVSIARQTPTRVREHLVDSASLRKWRCPTGYELIPPVPVEVTNLDDDVAGFSLAIAGGTVSEGGGTGAVALVFDSEPLAPVLVTLFASDATEGALGTTTVVVDAANWDDLADVLVHGVDDAILDGDVAFTVTAVTSSEDAAYDGLVADVDLVNHDDDAPSVVITDAASDVATPLVVSEAGVSDRFTVRLAARPGAVVTLDVEVDDATEGTVAPARVTLQPEAWADPVTFTVRGVDDDAVDGDVAFTISTTTTSTDPLWYGLSVGTVYAVNQDDDVAGLHLRPAGAAGLLQTSEAGASDTLTVSLDRAPLADVTVTLAIDDATEASLSAASLTFTPSNHATPQGVTVTGLDDDDLDGAVVFGVTATTTSTDAAWDGLVATATGLNVDDDVPVDEPDTDDDDPGSCGCDSPSAPTGALGLPLLFALLGLRRRRH